MSNSSLIIGVTTWRRFCPFFTTDCIWTKRLSRFNIWFIWIISQVIIWICIVSLKCRTIIVKVNIDVSDRWFTRSLTCLMHVAKSTHKHFGWCSALPDASLCRKRLTFGCSIRAEAIFCIINNRKYTVGMKCDQLIANCRIVCNFHLIDWICVVIAWKTKRPRDIHGNKNKIN
mgnify:CR=1 FL=1